MGILVIFRREATFRKLGVCQHDAHTRFVDISSGGASQLISSERFSSQDGQVHEKASFIKSGRQRADCFQNGLY